MDGNVLPLIINGEFKKSQQKIADFIINNKKYAFTMTAAELAKAAQVSEATVVRFAMHLGFDGYHDFQKNLRLDTKNQLTAIDRMDIASQKAKGSDVIKSVMKSDMANIQKTLDQIDFSSVNTAIDALLSAKRIYIAGVRSSAALVSFAGFYFDLIFDNCSMVTSTGGADIIQQLFHVKEGDVVLGISFPRYSSDMVKALEFSKKQGAYVISITDSMRSPIVEHSSCVLLAESNIDSFADSLVAPMSVLNALIFGVGYSRKEETKKTFEKLENLWRDYEVYDFNK